MPEILEKSVGKCTKTHLMKDELLDQIIETIKEKKALPKGEQWDSLSIVLRRDFASKSTFLRRFGSFEEAVKRALERIKEKKISVYYFKKD